MDKEFIINDKIYIFDGKNLELLKKTSDDNDKQIENKKSRSRGILQKLVFNVSNMCNLNCKYCYASGGNYKRENSIMDLKTADKIIDSVIKKYNRVNVIYFFGGEPLINFKLIKHIVERLENHYIGETLDFRIVTNGTFLTYKRLNYMGKHNFTISLSLDGPKDIHEFLRGEGSYDKIIDFINYVKENNIAVKLCLLCTYTKYHQDRISIKELCDFFERFKIDYMINSVRTDNDSLALIDNRNYEQREKQFIDVSFERILNNSKNIGISAYLTNVIDALVLHYSQYYFCKELANNYSLVYDYNGEEYSCLRFYGTYNKDDKILQKYNSKSYYKICDGCWCKNLCSVCMAEVFLNGKEMPFENGKCKLPILYEYVIKKIIKLLEEDEKQLANLLNNYYMNYVK